MSDEASWVAAFQCPNRHRKDKTKDEEVEQGMVGRVCGEETTRPDGAPDCAGVEVCARERTCEPIGSLRGTHAADIGKCPVKDTNL